MGVPSTELQPYLSADEPVRRAVPGTLIDDSYRAEGAICITDRRVLFVSNGDGILDAAYDSIDSIQCRPRTTLTVSGIGHRLLALVGVIIGVAGVVGVIVRQPSALASVLVLVAVGGAAVAEYVRRAGVGIGWTVADETRGVRGHGPRGIDVIRRDGGSERHDDSDVLLVLGIGLVSLAAVVGLIVHTQGLLVLLLLLVTLGGLALTDHAYRHTRALEETGAGRRYERALTIHLVGGRVVRLRVAGDLSIDRELSEAARGIEAR